MNVTKCGIQEVASAQYVGHVLFGIVYHYGKMVGVQTFFAFNYVITERLLQVVGLWALNSIVEFYREIVDGGSYCKRR